MKKFFAKIGKNCQEKWKLLKFCVKNFTPEEEVDIINSDDVEIFVQKRIEVDKKLSEKALRAMLQLPNAEKLFSFYTAKYDLPSDIVAMLLENEHINARYRRFLQVYLRRHWLPRDLEHYLEIFCDEELNKIYRKMKEEWKEFSCAVQKIIGQKV